MKAKYIIPVLAAIFAGGTLSSCKDMLESKTESFVDVDGLGGYDINDARYSAMGILSQIQKLGERYVVLGELRGDLVEVPATASAELQAISNFQPATDNSYSSRRDYYSVINNCNFALTKLDTLLVERNQKVLLPEYISIRTMRDWTYLQLGLTYGKAAWITEPLLSLEATEEEHEIVELDELVERLVQDITPFAGGETINYGTVDDKVSKYFIIPPEVLLADLKLYQNKYLEAAQLYYSYINKTGATITSGNGNHWQSVQQTTPGTYNFQSTYRNEVVAEIPYSQDAKNYHPNLINMTYNTLPEMVPAGWWMKWMNNKEYYYAKEESADLYSILQGDTRGEMNPSNPSDPTYTGCFLSKGLINRQTPALITKFQANGTVRNSEVSNPNNPLFEFGGQPITEELVIYRIPHLYLRYAEAINRAGKPSMAFAVIKYGLRNEVLNNEVDPKIDPEEWENHDEWLNFEDPKFDNNRGTASRGRGVSVGKSKEFTIPSDLALEEKIKWVENEILDEMAAETAFEGNRFFDLLRISRHEGNGDAWFAEKVGRRFKDAANASAMLSNRANWWLK